MSHSFIAFAIPFFLFFMALEYVYSKRKGKNFFQFAESIANLNVGVAERLTDVFTMLPFLYFFHYVHDHFALFEIRESVWTWIALFLLTDLIWYFYHRLAHEINLFWAAHVVHHQSEDFNYTTSARITVFQAVIRCLFWSVLPLIGFSAEMTTAFLLVHGIYPFFIHTQTIGKLGWIEKIFVTPSHHRVHHSSNPIYLDKNYGDVLIVWDKLFGTFVEETEKPVYGLTKPLNSYSFLWQHFHYPLELMLAMRRTSGWKKKIKILFGSPETLDPSNRAILERLLLRRQKQRTLNGPLKKYTILQTSTTLIVLFCSIFFYEQLSATHVAFLTAFILLSLINTGAILEQMSWIFYLELARLLLLLSWLAVFLPGAFTLTSVVCIGLIICFYFKPMEKKYKKYLYQQSES